MSVLRANRYTVAAGYAALRIKHYLLLIIEAFGILAPKAAKRASL